jgi:hypothetical protein
MDIMKKCANEAVTEVKEEYAHEIEKELDEEDARCKQEAQLPLRHPAPTQLTDLELNNEKISEEMSNHKLLKTFFGQKTHFSTTPLTQLTRSAYSIFTLRTPQLISPRSFFMRYACKSNTRGSQFIKVGSD